MATRRGGWGTVLRSPIGAVSATLLAGLLVLAVVAPIIWGDRATLVDTSSIGAPASAEHWFGSDDLGRDIFYRTLVATRLSILLALVATAIGLVVGVVLGALPTLLGRTAGRLVAAFANIAVAFPGLLLVLFFAVIFGVGAKGAVLALGLASAPFYARLTQTLAANVAGRDFVTAARVAGIGRFKLLIRHIIPNIGEQLVINAAMGAGSTLLSFAALSFLGLGIQPPSYDWGRLLNSGLDGIYVNPIGAVGPAVVIVLAGLAFNLFGETAAQVIGVRTGAAGAEGGFAPQSTGADVVESTPADETSVVADPVLVVNNLVVGFPGSGSWVHPVKGVSFTIARGEAVGIVGESGSGKSLTSLAVAQLIEHPGRVSAERLEFDGQSLTSGGSAELRHHLGLHLATVFQDPMTSFNPVTRIGAQLAEVSRHHEGLSRRAARDKAVDKLAAVRVPAPAARARLYPHELSGGMRQRAMIAMGLMGDPRLIIADEPTTALDVTVQRQVLRLLDGVRRDEGASILFISHDITVVRQVCSRVLVMYAGRIVEEIATERLYDSPRHPYTRALVAMVPDMLSDRDQPLAVIPGSPPDPSAVPPGCAFAPRCAFATEKCRTDDPALASIGAGHRVACWHPQDGAPRASAVQIDERGDNS